MATETLYISGAGDECNVYSEVGCSVCPNHYTCVDESPGHDSNTTYVSNGGLDVWERDLYNVQNSSVGSGTINWVRVYAVMRITNEPANYGKLSIKSGGIAEDSAAKALTTSWATYYEQWDTPPEGGSWTWAKIDALQAGASLYGDSGKYAPRGNCTQVYVVVDYTPFPTQYHGLSVQIGGSKQELCLVASGDGAEGMGGIPKLRKGGTTYDIYLVETTDGDASGVRVKTSAGTKSIRKYTT